MKVVAIKAKRSPLYKQYQRFGVTVLTPYAFSAVPKIWNLYRLLEDKFNILIVNKKLSKIDADYVLASDDITPSYIQFIREHNPEVPIIISYGNPISKAYYKPDDYRKSNVIFCAFEKKDCDDENVFFLPPAFLGYGADHEQQVKYDAYFAGIDKGRFDSVNRLANRLKELGYRVKLTIVENKRRFIPKKGYSRPLPYEKILDNYKKSNVIIDILQESQEGIELRVMAAIMYDKKLITNNKKISQEEFYSPNNIYIISDDSYDGLDEFMKAQITPYSRELKESLSFKRRLNLYWSIVKKKTEVRE